MRPYWTKELHARFGEKLFGYSMGWVLAAAKADLQDVDDAQPVDFFSAVAFRVYSSIGSESEGGRG